MRAFATRVRSATQGGCCGDGGQRRGAGLCAPTDVALPPAVPLPTPVVFPSAVELAPAAADACAVPENVLKAANQEEPVNGRTPAVAALTETPTLYPIPDGTCSPESGCVPRAVNRI